MSNTKSTTTKSTTTKMIAMGHGAPCRPLAERFSPATAEEIALVRTSAYACGVVDEHGKVKPHAWVCSVDDSADNRRALRRDESVLVYFHPKAVG